ncbi:hypothetical protein, partial [Neisseria sp. P0019.S002]|uniref:hypothetical protein n=1 Tax=Neisseria sp. P0019.S002 TaxID=3436798 RepID=UPI003F7EE980
MLVALFGLLVFGLVVWVLCFGGVLVLVIFVVCFCWWWLGGLWFGLWLCLCGVGLFCGVFLVVLCLVVGLGGLGLVWGVGVWCVGGCFVWGGCGCGGGGLGGGCVGWCGCWGCGGWGLFVVGGCWVVWVVLGWCFGGWGLVFGLWLGVFVGCVGVGWVLCVLGCCWVWGGGVGWWG